MWQLLSKVSDQRGYQRMNPDHPFLDGNGRVGRLLIPLFLIKRGQLSQPLLYLSQYFEVGRQEYYNALQRVRTEGDWLGHCAGQTIEYLQQSGLLEEITGRSWGRVYLARLILLALEQPTIPRRG